MGPYDDAFKRGLALMADRGLVLDRWHMPKNGAADMSELPRLAALAREFPTLTVVLNHLGGLVGPAVANDPEALAQWRAGIEELAGCPNVVCKLGGIQMAANGLGLEKRETPVGSDELLELTSPWYEHAVRTFGAARCLFESNYPVERDCVSYRTLVTLTLSPAPTLTLTPTPTLTLTLNPNPNPNPSPITSSTCSRSSRPSWRSATPRRRTSSAARPSACTAWRDP